MVVFWTKIDRNKTIGETVLDVHQSVIDSYKYYVPFQYLVDNDWIEKENNGLGKRFINFNYINFVNSDLPDMGEDIKYKIDKLGSATDLCAYNFSFVVTDLLDYSEVRCKYRKGLYQTKTIEKLLRIYIDLMTKMIIDNDKTVLDILSSIDLARLSEHSV